MVLNKILSFINDVQIAAAAVYPTGPYKGSLPKGTVKKGSKGSDALAVQNFLNWCIKAGLATDGIAGPKTVSAIKKYQKQYKLKVDGIFGSQSKKKAQDIIKKYAPKPAPAPAAKATWVDKANAWAKLIANDDDFGYMTYGKDGATHTCPICSGRVILKTVWDEAKRIFVVAVKQIKCKLKFLGWNCIGLAWSIWHHGAGIKCKCNCHVIDNGAAERMYKASAANALKIAQERSGLKAIKVIRNKKGIPKSQWKAGDICLKFSGSKYIHTFYYMGNKKICDATSAKKRAKQIAIRSYDNYSAKIIIRYTGK